MRCYGEVMSGSVESLCFAIWIATAQHKGRLKARLSSENGQRGQHPSGQSEGETCVVFFARRNRTF